MSEYFPQVYGHKDPIKIRLMDLVVLLDNTFKANEDKKIGFEDANQTLLELIKSLNREVPVERSDLESMLWSCNLLSEKEAFWHPKGLFFDSFVKSITRGRKFDFKTNIVSEKGKISNVE